MKPIIIITTLVAFSLITMRGNAQSEDSKLEATSIFSNGCKVSGWFIEMKNSSTRFNRQHVNAPGIAAGVMLNNNFMLGVAARSFSWKESYIRVDDIMPEPSYLAGGYGGILLEYAPHVNNVVHVSFPVIVGGGGAVYLSKKSYAEWEDEGEIDFSRKELSSSPYYVLEPGVIVEVNLTGFLKVSAGYSYRWLHGLCLENTNSNALNGSNCNIGFKIGKF